MKDKLKIYIEENLQENNFFSYSNYDYLGSNKDSIMPKKRKAIYSSERENSFNSDINKYIKTNNNYNDFQTLLFNLIDKKNLKDNDVYNKVHIDRRLFSKIRSDKNYHPSKETILLLGFSLELNENEIDNLLESASYSLPKNNYYDLIIRFCFINKIYKITEINNLLDEYNCKLFNY